MAQPPSTPRPTPSTPTRPNPTPRPPAAPGKAALPALAYVALALALAAAALSADVAWVALGHPVTSSTVLFHLAALFVLGQGTGLALARRATPTT